MAKKIIDLGTVDDANTGDSLYEGGGKINDNFTEVYDAVTLNTAKVGVTDEEANTIDSVVDGEPTGSDQVVNVVSLTQAEYDASTPIATTFYIITE